MREMPSPERGRVQRHAEAQFYDERWVTEADIRAKEGLLKKIYRRNAEMKPEDLPADQIPKAKYLHKIAKSSEDFMYANAVRDNEAFDKTRQKESVNGKRKVLLDKLDLEYALWQTKLTPVVNNIKEQVRNPEGSEKRILLYICGGGLKGPYSAGQVQGLHDAGIPPEAFKWVVGTSTGAAVGSFYMGGRENTARGSALYYEECTTKDFIDFGRP